MIKVVPTEPQDQEWTDWKESATAACEAIEAGDEINSNLYKGGRGVILKFFHGKCAYCESQLDADQRFGDVEHYRPKGSVTDENDEPVLVRGKKHPGYYWLAYDWTNLFPACSSCNRPGMHPDLTKSGKYDRFPITDETKRAKNRKDPPEPPEVTVLINPYLEDPAEHLAFDPATGLIAGKTKKGEITIKILGLDREGLRVARKRAARAAGDTYSKFTTTLINMINMNNEAAADAVRSERAEALAAYDRGELPYCAVGREAIQAARERAKKEL